MQAPKCTGKVEPPQMTAECKAKCDARVHTKAECTPPHIALRIVGAADAKVEATFRTAIEKNLPGILTVAMGTGKHVEDLAANMKVVIDGVQASIQGAGDPMVVAKLSGCILAPVKAAGDAVANVQANVKVSVSVSASASAHAG
jgi:hypothetical protein